LSFCKRLASALQSNPAGDNARANQWTHTMQEGFNAQYFNQFGKGFLPEQLGVVITDVGDKTLRSELRIGKGHLAPNGFLHAGTIITLADTSCGYACVANLPAGAINFTTIELKSNFLGTARDGVIDCEAQAIHIGRNTHVWDALVRHRESGKLIASFRCTQMVLWPKQ
jgi:1,4-dihydroxy-2-naphthoyl-CoA hydrolase